MLYPACVDPCFTPTSYIPMNALHVWMLAVSLLGEGCEVLYTCTGEQTALVPCNVEGHPSGKAWPAAVLALIYNVAAAQNTVSWLILKAQGQKSWQNAPWPRLVMRDTICISTEAPRSSVMACTNAPGEVMAGLLAVSLTVVLRPRHCGGFHASGIVFADSLLSSTANTKPHFTCTDRLYYQWPFQRIRIQTLAECGVVERR